MLHNLIASSGAGTTILEWVEIGALAIEILAVAIIIFSILYSFGRYLLQATLHPGTGGWYELLKRSLGRALLLGLEILVAADIVHTIALQASLESVAVLGLLVLIRTFLSWALAVEIEARWPWQAQPGQEPLATDVG
jgi:uncharacterized membrane protein